MLDVVLVETEATQHKKNYQFAHGFFQVLYARSRKRNDSSCLWIPFSHYIAFVYLSMFSEQEVQTPHLIQSIGTGRQPIKEILTDLYRVHLDSLLLPLMIIVLRILFSFVCVCRKHL